MVNYLRCLFAWVVLLGVCSCENEYFPTGLKGKQVMRLLTEGEQKTWKLETTSSECQFTVLYLFKQVEADSIEVIKLTPKENNCDALDSVRLGKAYPSIQDKTTDWFTDSLIFTTSNTFWIVESITSKQVILNAKQANLGQLTLLYD